MDPQGQFALKPWTDNIKYTQMLFAQTCSRMVDPMNDPVSTVTGKRFEIMV